MCELCSRTFLLCGGGAKVSNNNKQMPKSEQWDPVVFVSTATIASTKSPLQNVYTRIPLPLYLLQIRLNMAKVVRTHTSAILFRLQEG